MNTKPEIKSYETLMTELRREERRSKAHEGIGMAVVIAVGMVLAALALVGAFFAY